MRNANRRCASCGAFNPTERTECMNCGARLVTVVDAEPPEVAEEYAPAAPSLAAGPDAGARPPESNAVTSPPAASPIADATAADSDAPASPPPTAEPVEPAAEAEPPEWLAALHAIPEAPAAGSDVPGWLRELTEPASTAEPAVADSDQPDTLPDWLAELRNRAPAAQSPSAEPEQPSPDDVPAWLSDIGQPPAATGSVAAIEPEASGLQPGEAPDWLKSLRPVEPASSADASLSDVALDELPEWLRPAAPAPETASVDRAAPAAAEAAPADMPSGEIPTWIQALKPGALSTLSGEPLETSGLLAGIHGALPVESAVVAPHTRAATPEASVPAPVTGFSELSTPHAAPLPDAVEPTAPPKQRSGCLRLWLFLVIITAAAIPFLPLPIVSEARGAYITGHQATLDFYQTINQVSALRPGSLVLLGIDYSAGARGELDPQARAAVLHLLQNKQRIVAASFVADGGQLAQDALNSGSPAATGFNYPYAYGVTHVNAGYLSGGAAAMRNLAQNGLPAAGADFGGRPLADLQLTAGFKSAKAVDLVIVFTDDGAQLKHWIEQVARAGTPLVAGVSAATEPVAAPYYDSGQLKGLLIGQRGAAEYEVYLGRPASASASLDAISYVVLVLVLMIAGTLFVRLLSRPESA